MRHVAALLAFVPAFAGGCDVAIFGELELEGGAVRVTEWEGGGAGIGVGIVGDRTLVEWMRPGPERTRLIPTVVWLDGDHRPMSEPRELGVGVGLGGLLLGLFSYPAGHGHIPMVSGTTFCSPSGAGRSTAVTRSAS